MSPHIHSTGRAKQLVTDIWVYRQSRAILGVGLIVQNCLIHFLVVFAILSSLLPSYAQTEQGQKEIEKNIDGQKETQKKHKGPTKTDKEDESKKAAKSAVDDKISRIKERMDYQSELLHKMMVLIPQGRYREAIPHARILVDICEEDWGPEHENVATVLHNLGFLYQQTGDYSEAEPIFLRALAIREKALGPDHPNVARSLNGLALLYQEEGDYKHAEELFKRSLQIKEKSFGDAGPEYAIELNNLAVLYKDLGDYDQAETLLKKILTIFEKEYGQKNLRVATVLNNLAGVYRAKGDFNQAGILYERSMQIDKDLLANDHPDYARDLNNLALLYFEEGKYDLAEPLLKNALEITEKSAGPTHPDLVPILNNIGMLSIVQNKVDQAISYQTRANEISEQSLSMILSSGTEEQKRLFLAGRKDEINSTLSLNIKFAPENVEATRLALRTILRRKGRVLDAVSHQLLSLRQHLSEADQKLLDELSTTRADLSHRILHGPGQDKKEEFQKSITDLQTKSDQLEKEISTHSAAFRTQQAEVSVEAVQNVLPKDMTLIEFATYRLLDSKAKTRKQRYGSSRYVAYILNHDGAPRFIDLGDANIIDKGISELRMSLKNAGSSDYKQKARSLDKLVMEPVRKILGPNKTLILSPDGAMNLLPFAALIDQDGRFLIEKYSIDYLTSGRDLLRMDTHERHKRGPVIVANPQFSIGSKTRASGGPQANSEESRIGFMGVYIPQFKPLAGTADEAKSISAVLPDSKVISGKDATESVIKDQKGPRILHIATHGFFLPDAPEAPQPSPQTKQRSVIVTFKKSSIDTVRHENALLRSGIVLAGANDSGLDSANSSANLATNNSQNGSMDDGILTALEVSGMDLWGTKLVVLSACETGLGDLKQGEGVYGLRRAILIAGAETEVISLWPVSDQATAFLMIDFYKRLLSGNGRMGSLREAQLKIMKTLNHPYYWAAFIPVGDWRSLPAQGN